MHSTTPRSFTLRCLLAPTLALGLVACSDGAPENNPPAAPTPQAEAPLEVDLDDPSTCASCHAAVVAEWESSMHAHAHHSQDPIFAALRSLRMERQGAAIANECGSCHHPRAATEPDAPLAAHGVSCRSCHGVDEVRAGAGHAALTWAEGRLLRGPHDLPPDASPAHGTGPAAAHLTDGRTLCNTCHREAHNPAGIPTCNTGNELAASDPSATCTGCHMPTVDGPSGAVGGRPSHRSHGFLGPHAAWRGDDALLRSAVELSAALEGRTLVVTLRNRSGHAFPSGFPGRLAVLQAVAKAADGSELWRAWRESPSEAPTLMLRQVFLDAAGQPTMAPFATALGPDSRLTPDETRTLRIALPPEARTAASVDVSLRFFLIAPTAAQALGLANTPEATPRLVAEATAMR
ncbi:MAG: hypothetical protein IPH72_08950 [Sandaracinaceae bacterium]|nr:hypothetical protein [Sandaracinaceae bacterium]